VRFVFFALSHHGWLRTPLGNRTLPLKWRLPPPELETSFWLTLRSDLGPSHCRCADAVGRGVECNNGGPTTHAGGERYIELPAQPALCLEATVAEGELVDGVEGDDLWGVVHGCANGGGLWAGGGELGQEGGCVLAVVAEAAAVVQSVWRWYIGLVVYLVGRVEMWG
jgi:hypothetical protein